MRLDNADYQEDGQAPVAPSAVAIKDGQVYAPKAGKMADYPVPRALGIEEIPGIIQQAVRGARNAIAAGTFSCCCAIEGGDLKLSSFCKLAG